MILFFRVVLNALDTP